MKFVSSASWRKKKRKGAKGISFAPLRFHSGASHILYILA
jgi:hypothetical protein